jgi:adenine deaminase
MAVALGERPADLVVRGGTLANVYTGELLPHWGVAVAGSRIAMVGPEADRAIGEGTTVVDATGQVVTPGYIDGHTHLDYLHRMDHYLAAAIPTGLTTVITETAMLGSIAGLPAIEAFLAACPSFPITVLATAPTISYLLSDRGDGAPMLREEEMARLLEEPGVVGMGEAYWTEVLNGRGGLAMLVAKAQALGKTVEGHTAGARGAKLSAAVAAGLDSCHEPITLEQVQARLRLGLFTMIRDGSIRRDTSALAALPAEATRRLMLASDTVWAPDLLERGYLDEAARQAVARGLTPMQALQAITLVPAEHFGLDARVGGIAPGRQADLLVVPHLAAFRPGQVIARGRIVAREGRMVVSIQAPAFPAGSVPRPRLPAGFGLADLAVRAPAHGREAAVRTIHLAAEILTEERRRALPVQSGELRADPACDVLKVVALDRRGGGQVARGFVSGFGLGRGGFASSICFDTANLILLGVSDEDILAAADRMIALGGGVVVAAGGSSIAEVPLPLGGVTSQESMPVLAAQLTRLNEALRDLGCIRANPLLSAQVLTFTAIPALRIRERGLWDVRGNRAVSLFVEGAQP